MEIELVSAACLVRLIRAAVVLLLALSALAPPLWAETGSDAWLRYSPIEDKSARERYAEFPAAVVTLGDSPVLLSARDELVRGVRGMLGQTLRIESKLPKERMVLLATFDEAKKLAPAIEKLPQVATDGFWLKTIQLEGQNCLLITAPNERGVLYGAFALLKKFALGRPVNGLNEQHAPAVPLRVLSHRDSLNGTLDRGQSGESIFWEAGHVTKDLSRTRDYARLAASVGINGIAINHPVTGHRLLTPEYLKELSRVAAAMRPWGVQLHIALNSTTPPHLGASLRSKIRRGEDAEASFGEALPRAGSRDPRTTVGDLRTTGDSGEPRKTSPEQDAWAARVELIYSAVPDFGGFIVDADWGPGQGSPERSAANVGGLNRIAAALAPHGGVVFCRTCRCGIEIDPADPQQDPAKAAYDTFHPLDGQFADNVVLAIKHGPMDFQVREPPSPLFGSLEKTNQAIELDMTQHFLGQQRHLCFLVPMWKDVLDFDMHAKQGDTPVKAIISGKTFERPTGGFIAIANVTRAKNWLGHDLGSANLFGFGRLAWDANQTGKAIAEEWTRLTFSHDPLVVGALMDMLLKSWRIYESYTGPLAVGSLTDLGEVQYGPGIESSNPSNWAPWHNADDKGIGRDRTKATGSGFVSQYRRPVAERFESLETCPDALLLFMHHVPYTHTLNSGKSVIQHMYDVHYQGAREAARLVDQWESLEGRIDVERYQSVLARLRYQAAHARVWRDAVCAWFMNKSGIADNEGRVGNYPNRFEAEALDREGFEPQNVTPWETASGGQCMQLVDPSGRGALSQKYDGKAGWFNLSVAYFDESDGAAKYRLLVGGQLVDEWTADDTLPDNKPNGHTSTRRETSRVALRPGDLIRIEATADGGEWAAIDYLEIDPAGN